MNLYFRELKSHRKSLLFWLLGMVFLISSGIAKFAAYQTQNQSIATIVNQFPKSIQIIFGISNFDLSRASGYYGVLFLYIALLASAYSVLLGTEIISKEERDRTSEFLFVRPISRISVMTSKILAGFTDLIIFNVITLLSSIFFIKYFTKNYDTNHYIILLTFGLLLLQLIFFSIGVLFASITKKPRNASIFGTAYLLITLLIMYFINFKENLNLFKFLSPFKYIDAYQILLENKLNLRYILLSIFIIILSISISYFVYNSRDLNN